MKYILIDSGQNGYSIAIVPDYIADNIKYYQQQFDRWIMERSDSNPYWKELDGDTVLVYDGPTAFTRWLNENIVTGKESAILMDRNLPVIHF